LGEFFKGWRRKLGSMMLVLACLFMGGWMRSRNTNDYVVFWSGQHTRMSISSIGGSLCWSTFFEILEGEDEYLESELKPIQWASEPIAVGSDCQ